MGKTTPLRRDHPRRTAGQELGKSASKGGATTFALSGIVAWGILFSAVLAAYWPALHGGLLWDDDNYITRPDMQPLHGLWRIWFDLTATQQYYPLLHSAFWLEHRIWGDATLGYHLINLVFHAVSAFLVMRIMRRLTVAGAWLGGLVFALHPVNVEAVAWIAEQKNTLSTMFFLAAALAYLDFDKTRRRSRYWLAFGLFGLAILSKTVTAMLPAVLLVVLWWRRGNLEWKRDVEPLVPWFAIGVPAGLFTGWVERTIIGASGPGFALTMPQHVLLAGRIICFYAGKLVWPVNLAFSYPRWIISPGVWWQWLFPAAALAFGIALCVAARRYRGPLAGFLVFMGTLFPVLGFLNVLLFRYTYVADHFEYPAELGIIVPVTAALAAFAQRKALGTLWKTGLSAGLILLLVGLTWRQSATYVDLETLYRATLARNSETWLVHNNLGLLLAGIPGRAPEAIAEYREAIRLEPDYPEAHFNLGSAIAHSDLPDRLPAAIGEYRTALRLKPDYAMAYNNLGNALSHLPGRLPDAVSAYRAALRTEPGLAEAHANLGNALAQTPGELPAAIAEYQAALGIEPGSARLHASLGNAMIQVPERQSEAIAEYQTALRLDPGYAEAHYYLAGALAEMPGREAEARNECEAALAIRPDFEPARELWEHLSTARK